MVTRMVVIDVRPLLHMDVRHAALHKLPSETR